ncbi:flagellar hook-associated protein 3 [Photobacterium gaetbulicola]|uniref:Putative flagellar hook-associated protein FlgL n=1 Tax=Photobacterium gaetbulicola Gung47 TaxID=658445 RepID=A0A0C5WT37_9GAMM|nr:flagellar hook-associated protein FlgL [Photobacterium gaetbulicola]AJR09567.1 putative flagellar hook-associated protein FlgL [Photobacterium gaetbulicola Gung47]PSU14360.1 flagellar hook-associated protein 3 [Photobacterium gaetbulicola]
MINRVSTFSQYQNLTSNLMRKQGAVNNTNEQLATGKRIKTAGDDPIASVSTQKYKQQLVQIEQFQKSITLANNRLGTLETSLKNVESHVDSAKQKVIGMINGAMAGDDKTAFKNELESLYEGLLNLANTQDEGGNYVFAGHQVRTQPFVADASGQMQYLGDSGHREARIDTSVHVKTSQPGDLVFMGIDNPFGDYRPDYAGLQDGSELSLLSAENSVSTDSSAYRVDFHDNGAGGFDYELFRDGASLGPQQPYDPAAGIAYSDGAADLKIQFNGELKDGDSVSLDPASTIDLFETLGDAIKYSEYPTSSPEARASLQRSIEELNASYVHMNQRRAEVGTEMKTLDTYESQHKDFELSLNKAKGSLEDLDYSKAIIELNEDMLALQASQAAFNQTKQLSLFNYL